MSKQKISSDKIHDRIDEYLEEMDSVDMIELYNFIADDNITTLDVDWDGL